MNLKNIASPIYAIPNEIMPGKTGWPATSIFSTTAIE